MPAGKGERRGVYGGGGEESGEKRRFRQEEERGEGQIAIVVFRLDLLNSDALLKVFAADHVG